MSGASYAVKRDHITPTALLIARIILNAAEKSIAFVKLEQMLYLADWKYTQATGRSWVETEWIHDNEMVTGVALFDKIRSDNHFVVSDLKNPRAARVALALQIEAELPADLKNAVATHLRFLDGQGPSALKSLCKDSYPVRSSRPGKKFQLDERFLAYKQSRRAPA